MTPEDSPIIIRLNGTAVYDSENSENISNDPRLHALNEFLSALKDGMADSVKDTRMNWENAVNKMFSAITRKLMEGRHKGELFTIEVSSIADPASNKLTWKFDFKSEFPKK